METRTPAAISPFDAAEAKAHQRKWAEYLGVEVEIVNSLGMKLTLIPPDEFLMGSPASEAGRDSDETPHRVRITKANYLGTYEVTQEEYERVMVTNPSNFRSVSGQDTNRFPVESVSWEAAVEFCGKLSALSVEQSSGRAYRLPTEAEWEYACSNGVRISSVTGTTQRRRWTIQAGRLEACSGCSGAAVGRSSPGSAGRPTAGACRRTGTTTWASASRGQFPSLHELLRR